LKDYWHEKARMHSPTILRAKTAYEVVEPEIGTVIYELPEDYERVEIEGNSYCEFSNVLFEKIQINEERAYEVIGFIEQ